MSELQQVNLYVADLQPKGQTFGLTTMMYGWAATLLLFAIIQFWGSMQTREAETRLQDLKAQEVKVLQQLTALRSSSPRDARATVEDNLDQAREEIAQRRQLMQLMQGRTIGNSEGFSPFLLGLSRQHMEGLSLDYFTLRDGGEYIELSGWTRRPEIVPDYVQNLRDEESFKDTRFGDMSIERAASERTDALRFYLGDGGES